MKNNSPKILRMYSDVDADRISSLPKNVIQAILMRLPIRNAVRTSILSQGWRYEWSTLPQIVIDKECFPFRKGLLQEEFNRKIVKLVDHILLLHCGPIHKFKLSVDMESCTDIDKWILFLSRNGIKELTLDIFRGEKYKLPSCLFSCMDLTFLELYSCIFLPPTSFKGFKKLTVLDLQCVIITDNWLELLLSGCQLLKKLRLSFITGCTCLEICSQELVDLEIEGPFEDLYLRNTPLLATASISLETSDDSHVANKVDGKIGKILDHIPSIQRLELLDRTLENLAVGDIPVCLPVRCPLKHLLLDINFEDMQEMLATFCIFRSSLVMQMLDIKAISNKETARTSVKGFWEGEEDLNCAFSQLRNLKITDFCGYTSELKFIEFVLANAPVLETLHLEFEEDVGNVQKIFRELIRFRRSSPKAEIIVPA